MRILLLVAVTAGTLSSPALAQYGGNSQNYGSGYTNPRTNQSDGYVRRDGGYVAPHQRTNPNNTRSDNYSTQGNVNPYTGQSGNRKPW